MKQPIDINDESYYEYKKPKERTRKRLQQLIDLGLHVVGDAQFGMDGIFSGLYIESVWSLDEDGWNGYIEFAKSVFPEKAAKNKLQKEVEEYIQKNYKYYKGEVYTNHLENLAVELMKIHGAKINHSNKEDFRGTINKMVLHMVKENPELVDIHTHRNWVNNNYKSTAGIPPFM